MPAVKISPLVLALALLCGVVGTSMAQQAVSDSAVRGTISIRSIPGVWNPLFGSFLEPNRFGTVYDVSPKYLRLEAGFGGRTLSIGKTSLGAECLIWSGLKSLSNFRFPVETADYFFGLYGVFPISLGEIPITTRVRLSHISSHWVDGVQDSIVGGSSSRYSREFASVEFTFGDVDYGRYLLVRESIGLKVVFHQVTKVEQTVQVPIAVELVPIRFGENRGSELLASLSGDAGAYSPMLSAALVGRFRNGPGSAMIELYGEYHTGATRYGVKGTLKENGFELGLRISQNLLGS